MGGRRHRSCVIPVDRRTERSRGLTQGDGDPIDVAAAALHEMNPLL